RTAIALAVVNTQPPAKICLLTANGCKSAQGDSFGACVRNELVGSNRRLEKSRRRAARVIRSDGMLLPDGARARGREWEEILARALAVRPIFLRVSDNRSMDQGRALSRNRANSCGLRWGASNRVRSGNRALATSRSPRVRASADKVFPG